MLTVLTRDYRKEVEEGKKHFKSDATLVQRLESMLQNASKRFYMTTKSPRAYLGIYDNNQHQIGRSASTPRLSAHVVRSHQHIFRAELNKAGFVLYTQYLECTSKDPEGLRPEAALYHLKDLLSDAQLLSYKDASMEEQAFIDSDELRNTYEIGTKDQWLPLPDESHFPHSVCREFADKNNVQFSLSFNGRMGAEPTLTSRLARRTNRRINYPTFESGFFLSNLKEPERSRLLRTANIDGGISVDRIAEVLPGPMRHMMYQTLKQGWQKP